MSPWYFGIVCHLRKNADYLIRTTNKASHICIWHAHLTRMSTRHQCETSTWRHEAHLAAVVRGWCSCCRCLFRCPLNLSLLARAPDCPRLCCGCCCRPAAVGTPYERRHLHSWKNVWKPFIKQWSTNLNNTGIIVIPLKASYAVALDRQC